MRLSERASFALLVLFIVGIWGFVLYVFFLALELGQRSQPAMVNYVEDGALAFTAIATVVGLYSRHRQLAKIPDSTPEELAGDLYRPP